MRRLLRCNSRFGHKELPGYSLGGRVLNCARAVNDALPDVRLVNSATLAEICTVWSQRAINYDERGYPRSHSLNAMPEWILMDRELIAGSDACYLQAGIVDALAKQFEFEPYQ